MKAGYFFFSAMVLLAGCGADEPPQTQSAAEEGQAQQETEKPGGVIPQYQLDALEKAKKVEDQLQEAAEERAAAVDNP
ncbi:hypothetical protein [Microbulbifer hainanensis]|uniref:hypothetical protein n=1 Tax=Microbulbifer hainanensis TaxID=2735675 RepID=UPI001865D809|nr:hypothetical protein [Microbulbifer hainanensis]